MEAFSFPEAFRRLTTQCPAAAQLQCVQLVCGEQVTVPALFCRLACMRCHCRRLPPPPPPAACRLPPTSFVPLPLLLQSSPTPHQHLQALQQLLVQYDYTLPAASLFRPVLLKAVAALVEAAVAPAPAPPSSTAAGSPQLAVALLTVLELAPHTQE